MIFACPSPFKDFEETEPGINAAFLMSRVLWTLGVGELAKLEPDGWTLLGQGDHVLWSERRGPAEVQRWSIKPQVGSR